MSTATTSERPGAHNAAAARASARRPAPRLRALPMGIPPAPHALLGWIIPTVLAIVGAAMRFYRLGFPHSLVFDETYYVKDAYALSQSGYERNWTEKANELFNQGDPSGLLSTPEYVVHPPLGKWILSLGIDIFGVDDSFGWRFSAALFGALSIFLLARIATRMFSSVWMGAIAGLLLTVDGEHFVHSRTGLLDLFVMFFVLLAFGFLIIDRDRTQRKLGRLAEQRWRQGWLSPSSWGPSLGVRPWLIAAGVSLGLSMGVKWSGIYALAAFGVMVVLWDIGARRRVGVRTPWRAAAVKDALPDFLSLVPVAVLTYIACWWGWLTSSGGYGRDWAEKNHGWWSWLPDWLVSLAHYHYTAYQFHVGLDSEHPYMSNPWGWIVQWKPTSFYYQSPTLGQDGCAVDKCSQAITSVGNPVIWGLAVIAVAVLIVCWALRRDWRAGAILAGLIGTWGPWFLYQHRTIFTFYTIVMVPFVVLALTYCLGLLWGSNGAWAARLRAGGEPGAEDADGSERSATLAQRRARTSAAVARGDAAGGEAVTGVAANSAQPARGAQALVEAASRALVIRRLTVGLVLAAAVLAFAYFYPIYVGETIPYDDWRMRMLNPTWI